MDTKVILAVVIGLVVGAGGFALLERDEMPREGMHMMSGGETMEDESMAMHGAMDSMMAGLYGKTGDAFDQAFLAEMIVHHEGAVEMAQAALRDAKHAELKQMAEAIIAAQTQEIEQMKTWQKSWYGAE